jgi:WD40 repeat protein
MCQNGLVLWSSYMQRYWFIPVMIAILMIVPVSNAQDDAPSSGQLAIEGTDGNIHIYDVDNETFTQITDVGSPSRLYFWPTWSNDGQLAYFGTSREASNPFGLGIFVQPDPLNSEQIHSFISPGDVFTYAYWAPGDCPDSSCRDLAVLYTAPSGNLALRMARSSEDAFDIAEIETGGPFYWDWSPDGQSMFWARFGETLEIYDVASDEVIETFPEQQGFQRAVDWSPVDDRLLSAVLNESDLTDLILFDGDERVTLLSNIEGVISFEWSPDGEQIAYLDSRGGQLGIIDTDGNDIASPAASVVAFFWAPTGDKLAFLTIGSDNPDITAKPAGQDELFLLWNVYDLADGSAKQVASIIPTRQMVYYLNFFDQFARSHSFWSPDGRYLTFGQRTPNERNVVSIVDVTEENPVPQEVMEGNIGIFSWN